MAAQVDSKEGEEEEKEAWVGNWAAICGGGEMCVTSSWLLPPCHIKPGLDGALEAKCRH